jgi:hypothetical protein
MATIRDEQAVGIFERLEFSERNMRKFRNLNEALKAFDGRFNRRRIVRLFQQTYTIRINNLSMNVASLEQSSEAQREKFFEIVFRKNDNLVRSYMDKMRQWQGKFDDKEIGDIEENPKPVFPINSDKNVIDSEKVANA